MFRQDIFRAFLLQGLLLAAVVPLASCLIFLPISYVQNNPDLSQTATAVIVGVPLTLFVIIGLGSTVGVSWYNGRQRRAWLDAAFTQFGFTAEKQGSELLYQGQYEGRLVIISFQRTPWVEWRMATTRSGKFGITHNDKASTRLSGLNNRPPLKLPPALAALYVVADDKKGVVKVLKQSAVKTAVFNFLDNESDFLIRQILLQDGQMIFRLYRSRRLFHFMVSPEQARLWLADLAVVTAAFEKQG